MARYVILDAQNRIVNRCEWDGVSAWQPPEGQRAMLEATAIKAGYADTPQAPATPESITNFQARAALLEAGLFEQADAAAKAAGGVAWQAWEFANVFERGSPTIAALAGGLGLSDAQIDALFVAAAQKTA